MLYGPGVQAWLDNFPLNAGAQAADEEALKDLKRKSREEARAKHG